MAVSPHSTPPTDEAKVAHQDTEVALLIQQPVEEVTPLVLKGWLRRARRKFINGVGVLKMTALGKLVRRTVFVDAKPEYFEITSAKLFDLGYHLSDIDEICSGVDSPNFEAFKKLHPDRLPSPDSSCVVHVESRMISLVFKTEADRRDFVFLMRVLTKMVTAKYSPLRVKSSGQRSPPA